MKTTDKNKDRIGTPVEIKPVSFRPGGRQRGLKAASRIKWIIGAALALLLILLCTSAWFVFTARQVVIQIEPEPSRISIQGGMAAPKLGTTTFCVRVSTGCRLSGSVSNCSKKALRSPMKRARISCLR